MGHEADAFMAAYGVTRYGNLEGKSILEFDGDMEQRPALAEERRKLFEAREQRVHPGRDDKVLTSWNGLMLAAFAEAARVLDRNDYRLVAEHNAEFLLHVLQLQNGRLLCWWKAGEAKLNGYLENFAYLVDGLLELCQTAFDPRWFATARDLAEPMIAHYQSPQGGFLDTSDDHETLISLPPPATPSTAASSAPRAARPAPNRSRLRGAC